MTTRSIDRDQNQSEINTSEKLKKLVHELEVHQLELEMQNEELRATREKLDQSLARFEDLFELAPIGYLVLNSNGLITSANLKISTLLQTERNKLLNKQLNEFVTSECQDTLLRHLRMTFKQKDSQITELDMLRDDGSSFILKLESIVQPMGDKSERQCLTVCTDITEHKQQEAIIHRQANYDALTDLPNRTLFLDRLAYTMRLADREHSHLAVFFIDLDNFKGINDTYGHAVGDQVIIETGRRLEDCARNNDTVSRFSGDEFCMLLPRVSGTTAASSVARKIMEIMEKPFILKGGVQLDIACSIGIAIYPKDGANSDILLNNADMALYQAKKAGRRQFVLFSKIMDEEIIRRQHKLGLDLKNAILNNEMILHFQPIIDIRSNKPFGVEVLVRWQHPEYGLLPPGEFISLAESNGSIVELGEWVLKTATEQIRNWKNSPIVFIAFWVNLSTRQCGNSEREDRLKTALETITNNWVDLPRLGLEITESEVLDLSNNKSNMFDALHQQGIFLSIDDFGTGYSSLKRLTHLPIDFIKVDKSFVADIEDCEKSLNLTKAIIALGHSINARIVAEGIETENQLRILHDLGCDFGQGFHIAYPMNSADLEEFFKKY